MPSHLQRPSTRRALFWIGLVELAGGALGVLALLHGAWAAGHERVHPIAPLVLAIYAGLTVNGWWLLRARPGALPWGVLLHGLQVPLVSLPRLHYDMLAGVGLWVRVGEALPGGFDVSLPRGASAHLRFTAGFGPWTEAPGWVGLNLLAALITAYLVVTYLRATRAASSEQRDEGREDT